MKIHQIAAIGALLLLLIACAPGGTDRGDENINFRTGSQGLLLRFTPNAPPVRLYDNEQFNALLEVRNIGATPVGGPGDRVYLHGFDPNLITGVRFVGEPIDIDAKDQFNLEGGFDTVAFKGTVRRLTSDSLRVPLTATACYAYETLASANVCIDPDPYSPTVKTKACTPQDVGLGTQAAPIAVSNVEVEARPDKTVFRIHISDVGGGDVFRYGGNYLTKCSPYDPRGLAFDEVDYVQLTDVLISGVSIKNTCKPLDIDHIRLSEGGQATIVCELNNIRSNAAYTTPLNVILRYGYRNQIQQSMEIVRAS